MFTRKITGTLVAASLTASALMMMPSASAAPTFVKGKNISGVAALPQDAVVGMSENGDSVAAWLRDGQVMAASADKGTWTASEIISAEGAAASKPAVAMNDAGEAVVTWVQPDADADVRVVAARMNAEGTFGNPTLISANDWFPVVSTPSVGLDGAGTLFAAYEDSNDGNVHEVRVTTWTKAGVSKSIAASDLTARGGSIAVNESGQALVVFHDLTNGSEVVNARRYDPATQLWSAPDSAGLVGDYSVETEAALSDNGSGTIAYTKEDGAGDFRAMSNTSSADGNLGGASFASPAGFDAIFLDLDQNDAGTAVLAYDRVGNGNYVGYTSRNNGTWAPSKVVEGALASVAEPQVAISETGYNVIAWDDDEHQVLAYRSSTYNDLVINDSGSGKFSPFETAVGIDNQGNVVLTGVIHSADPTQGFVTGKVLDTAGPVSWMGAPGLNTIGTTVPVSWNAADRFSLLGASDVKVRTAFWNGTFGGSAYAAADFDGTSLDFAGKGGRTYCFSARAVDSVGNSGAFSTEKCTTTPLDDGALTNAGGFKRVTSANGYNGGYSVATTKGSSLRITGVKASRLALLVSKVGTGGKVEVYFHGDKLGTYSLVGAGNKVVVPVATLGSVENGTVVIKVISANGKTVRIDGLIAAK